MSAQPAPKIEPTEDYVADSIKMLKGLEQLCCEERREAAGKRRGGVSCRRPFVGRIYPTRKRRAVTNSPLEVC